MLFTPLLLTNPGQSADPASDISDGAWVASDSSGNLYDMLDDVSDADYIYTMSNSTCEVEIGDLFDPATSEGHVVGYRISGNGSANLTVTLKQGASTIASWTHTPAPTSPTSYERTLSGAEADAITDYSDLRISFQAA
jgi:hypothetical protein